MAQKSNTFKTECYWCVKQIHIFRDLSDEDARALGKITTFKNLKHEEWIGSEGVYLIKEGRIKVADNPPDADYKKDEKRSPNSDETQSNRLWYKDKTPETKEVLEPGEILGVIHTDDANLRQELIPISFAETLTEVCVGIVTTRDFMFFLKRKPQLALPLPRRKWFDVNDVLKKSHLTLSTTNNKKENPQFNSHNILNRASVPDLKQANALNNIIFRCASSRLALLLHNFALVPDSSGNIYVPRMSKKRISKLIGSSTETVVKLLNTFKQHHVIGTKQGRIQILDPWQLKKIADARMRTLLPLNTSTIPTDQGIDLQTLSSIENANNNQIRGENRSSQLLSP